jgi:hypothetical protein
MRRPFMVRQAHHERKIQVVFLNSLPKVWMHAR